MIKSSEFRERLELFKYADLIKKGLDLKVITARSSFTNGKRNDIIRKIVRKGLPILLNEVKGENGFDYTFNSHKNSLEVIYNIDNYDDFIFKRNLVEQIDQIDTVSSIDFEYLNELRQEWCRIRNFLLQSPRETSGIVFNFNIHRITIRNILIDPLFNMNLTVDMIKFHQKLYQWQPHRISTINLESIPIFDVSRYTGYNPVYGYSIGAT